MSNVQTCKLIEKLWARIGASGTGFKPTALKKFRRSVSAWFILDIAHRVNVGDLSRDDAVARLKAAPDVNDVRALVLLDAAQAFLKNEAVDLDAVKAEEEAEGRVVVNGKPVNNAGAAAGGAAPVTKDDEAMRTLAAKYDLINKLDFRYITPKGQTSQIYANMFAGRTMLFVGPPGCGKTTLAKKLAQKKGYERPFYRVQMNENSTDQTLVGSRTIVRESVPTGEYAKYLAAVKRLEEANAIGDEDTIAAADAAVKRHMIVVEGANGTEYYSPIEEYVEVPKMVWQDGPVVQAMLEGVDRDTGEVIEGSRGAVLLIDEFEAAPAGVMMVLQGLAEQPEGFGRRELVLAEDGGRVIRAHPQFCIIFTGNTWGMGDMTGRFNRMVQDAAFLDRIKCTFKFDYPDIGKVIEKAVRPDFAAKTKQFFDMVQGAIKKNELQIEFGVRRILALVEEIHLCGKFDDALKATILNPLGSPESAEYQKVKGFADAVYGSDYQYRQ